MRRTSFILAGLLVLFAADAYAATRIVALGASNVEGWGIQQQSAFPAVLEAKLRGEGYDVQIENSGVNWNTSKMMLDRLPTAVPAGTSIVILAENVRDWTNAYMPEIEKRLKERGVKVVRASFRVVPGSLFQRDRIHLTEEGQAYFANILAPRVAALLKKK